MNRVKDNQASHVAILVFPFGTHGAPLLHLTNMLAQSSPNTTFSFFNTAISNQPLLSSQRHDLINVKIYNVDDGVPEGYMFSGKRHEDIDMFLSVTPETFMKGMKEAVKETGKKITCLLADSFIWHAADMADEMKVDWIQFWTGGAGSLSAHFYTDHIRDTAAAALDHSGQGDLHLNFVPGMPSNIRLKDVPMEVHGGNLDSVFAHLLHKMGQTMSRGKTIALNSFEELDSSILNDFRTKFDNVLPVGPFSLSAQSPSTNDPFGCIAWLDTQKPASVVYISFGTLVNALPSHELIALAEALEKSGVSFIWSLNDRLKKQLPDRFLDRTSKRGMVIPWAPQSQILEHAGVGAFLTHCGWNSVLESISGGVPMILRPFFGDQRMNGRFVSDVWGTGVLVKDGILTHDGLMGVFDLMISKEEGMKFRKKAGELKQQAMRAVQPDGSSTMNFMTLSRIVTESCSF